MELKVSMEIPMEIPIETEKNVYVLLPCKSFISKKDFFEFILAQSYDRRKEYRSIC